MEKTEPGSAEISALVRVADQPPTVLPALLLDDLVPFPGPVVPVLLDEGPRRDAVLNAKSGSGYLALINRRAVTSPAATAADTHARSVEAAMEAVLQDAPAGDLDAGPQADEAADEAKEGADADALRSDEGRPVRVGDLSPIGIVARLIRVVKLPDERISALVHLLRRAQPTEVLKVDPFPILRVLYPVEVVSDEQEFQALYRQVRANLQAFFEAHPSLSEELKIAAMSIEVPGVVADFVGQHLSRDFEERLAFLTELDLARRMRRALEVSIRELDLLTVGNRITNEIREKVEKHQREYLLREQLKAIRAELGEERDPATLAVAELRAKLDAAGLSDAARQRADEELKRLQHLPPESPEHNVVRSYLEWIASLPWSKVTEERRDIDEAREVLDADHYGLDEIKDRIIEFLAVHQLRPEQSGSLLCFAGPPGVGKTSLGQSVARALGRHFYRFSVGGMRDEAEIKGHRRTYVGAMPGRILQGLRHVASGNPVFMLDELDKMGSDWRGDPSSALLEVLDPAQNQGFVDHYLDLPFDLRRVMFIATANIKTEIPPALRDRLEIIDLAGYIPEEKLEIAMRHLLPRQRREHGLSAKQLLLGRPAIKRIIREYTSEAGVRELERQIGKVCRKRATAVVRGHTGSGRVAAENLPAFLGPAKIHDDRLTERPRAGVAVGLAWTAVGGEVLFIEVVRMPGKGGVKVTGHLGEVMSESAGLAVSYVRSHAGALGVDPAVFSDSDLHLHFPAGAVRKDGPSAGVTVTTALISLLTDRRIQPRLAMTGEMTLRGEVLPVGGIREKVVAAHRAGVRTVVVPARNHADVEEIPEEVRSKLTFVFAAEYDDVFEAAFGSRRQPVGAADKSGAATAGKTRPTATRRDGRNKTSPGRRAGRRAHRGRTEG